MRISFIPQTVVNFHCSEQKVSDDRLGHRLSTAVYIGNKTAVHFVQVGIFEGAEAS
jgi:hypothetical protein